MTEGAIGLPGPDHPITIEMPSPQQNAPTTSQSLDTLQPRGITL